MQYQTEGWLAAADGNDGRHPHAAAAAHAAASTVSIKVLVNFHSSSA